MVSFCVLNNFCLIFASLTSLCSVDSFCLLAFFVFLHSVVLAMLPIYSVEIFDIIFLFDVWSKSGMLNVFLFTLYCSNS